MIREIGAGAFGTVWLAHDDRVQRDVAVKVVRSRNEGRLVRSDGDQLLAEARTIGQFSHPNIATLFGVHAVDEGEWALEMEYLDRGSLEDDLADGRGLPPSQAAQVASEIAAGLAAAHAAGIVHGDLKPANVLRSRSGNLKLVDFGLARILEAQARVDGRPPAQGTPQYMSPEAVMGEALTPASDVWSFGVLLFRLLTGRLPFRGATVHELFFQVHNEPAPPMPDVPGALATLVERCLDKDPAGRPADGAALVAALEAAPAETSPSRRRPAPRDRGGVYGRENELSTVREALADAIDGRARVLLVTGPVGIGKSTLLVGAATLARELGCRWASASVSPVEGLLRPLQEAARRLAEPGTGSGPEPRPVGRLGTQALPDVEALLRDVAARRPIAIALEDMHGATGEEVRLLRRLSLHLRDARIAWLLTERTPDLGVAPPEQLRCGPLLDVPSSARIDLSPLPGEALFRVLSERAPGEPIAGAVAEHVVRRSHGNPLFALELLRHLQETGAVQRVAGVWTATDGLEKAAAPPVLRDLVARRLHRLPAATRDLLDVAAVDGMRFDGRAIAAVLEHPPLAVLRTLQRLCRTRSVVVSRDNGYQFAHPLIQEVIYAGVSPELRSELHRQLAKHLEARGAGVDPERLGVHWERGERPAEASPYLLRAAGRAVERREIYRAVDLAARAGLSPNAPIAVESPTLYEDGQRVAFAYSDLGRHAEAFAVAEALVHRAVESADARAEMGARAVLANLRYVGGKFTPEDEAALRRAAEPGSVDVLDQAKVCMTLGKVAKYRGQLDAADVWLLQADTLLGTLGTMTADAQRAAVLNQRGSIALRRGAFAEAERLYGAAADSCRRIGHLGNAAASDVNCAAARVLEGELDGALDVLSAAIRSFELEGMNDHAWSARVMLADVHYSLGDGAIALKTVRAACEALEKSGYGPGLVQAWITYGGLLVAGGHLAQARRPLEEGAALAARLGHHEGRLQAAACEVLRRAYGRDPSAEEAAAALLPEVDDAASPAVRAAVGLAFAEAGTHGLPSRCLVAAMERLESTESSATGQPAVRAATAALRGAIAYCAPRRDRRVLITEAANLARERIGSQRSIVRALGLLYAAAAGGSEGVDAGCQLVALAERLGHPWLRLEGLWLSRRDDRGPGAADEVATALVDLLGRTGDAGASARLRAAWAARGVPLPAPS